MEKHETVLSLVNEGPRVVRKYTSVINPYCAGRTEAAMTSSIMTFLTLGSGPLVAFLVQKFGHRWITLIGEIVLPMGSGPIVAFL